VPVAAVLGWPLAHTLSPALHQAAYRAAGLDDWTYLARRWSGGGRSPGST
jgi:shikimate 5-dehydrogenase